MSKEYSLSSINREITSAPNLLVDILEHEILKRKESGCSIAGDSNDIDADNIESFNDEIQILRNIVLPFKSKSSPLKKAERKQVTKSMNNFQNSLQYETKTSWEKSSSPTFNVNDYEDIIGAIPDHQYDIVEDAAPTLRHILPSFLP